MKFMNMFDHFLPSWGELSLHGLTATSHLSYGSVYLLRAMFTYGIRFIMVLPQYPMRCHPFVGSTFLKDRHDGYETETGDAHRRVRQVRVLSIIWILKWGADRVHSEYVNRWKVTVPQRSCDLNGKRRCLATEEGPLL